MRNEREAHPTFSGWITKNTPACSGPCDQGRRKCSTPDACELGEPVYLTEALWLILPFVAAFLGAVGMLIVIFFK